jgi:hypothetical protein
LAGTPAKRIMSADGLMIDRMAGAAERREIAI